MIGQVQGRVRGPHPPGGSGWKPRRQAGDDGAKA